MRTKLYARIERQRRSNGDSDSICSEKQTKEREEDDDDNIEEISIQQIYARIEVTQNRGRAGSGNTGAGDAHTTNRRFHSGGKYGTRTRDRASTPNEQRLK